MPRSPKGLNVGGGLVLPLDAITQSIALLAIKRAGKSNAAAVLAEEMFRAGLPWVGIDPKGDWWGLRSSGDGEGPGLPVPIFGGLHGDLPLMPEHGKLIADLIVDQNLTCILDVSDFDSKAAQMRFLTDLGNQLFRRHGRSRTPRHLFLEEADDFLPQVVRAEMARCVGIWSKIVKQGGQRGLGVSIISQRSAVVNKDALSQCETLIALRTVSALDRKAIRDWVSYQSVGAELVDSLPGLHDGEAWIVSPHWLARSGQEAVQRVTFRRRETFDSGATPEVGITQPSPALADIDLGALEARMAAVVEKAAADDPKVLRKRIAELERVARTAKPADTGETARLAAENASLRTQLAEALARPPERVEVPVITPGDSAAIEQAIAGLRDVAGGWEIALSRAARPAAEPAAPARRPAPERIPAPRDAWPRTIPDPADPSELASLPAPDAPATAEGGDAKLGKAERAVLAVLAQFPEGRTRPQLAVLSGYAPTSLKNPLGRLRTLGLVGKGDPIMITDSGLDAIGDGYEPLPAGHALVDHWMAALGKAERIVLGVFLDIWPESPTRAELAELSGYSEASLKNPLGRLRTLGLVHDWTADETLARAAREGATR